MSDPTWTAEIVPGLITLTQLQEVERSDEEYMQRRKAMDALRPKSFKSCIRCQLIVPGDRCECGSVCFNHHCLNASELLKLIDGEEPDDVKMARFNRLYEKEEAAIAASVKTKENADAPLKRDDPFPAPTLTGLKVRKL